jgi:hypothetical protein
VTETTVDVTKLDGVPEMIPVDVLNDKPDEAKFAEMVNDEGVLMQPVGVMLEIKYD